MKGENYRAQIKQLNAPLQVKAWTLQSPLVFAFREINFRADEGKNTQRPGRTKRIQQEEVFSKYCQAMNCK